MKKWAAIIGLLITSQCLTAQVNINMNLAGRPPANLSEWANRREVLTFIMSGSQSDQLMVKIKAEIKTLDGTVIGATNLNTAKSFSPLPGASTVLGALDVLPLEHMIFTGKYQSALAKTGKLPADNCTLCSVGKTSGLWPRIKFGLQKFLPGCLPATYFNDACQ